MCMGSSPSMPAPPPAPVAAPPPPTPLDPSVVSARQKELQTASLNAGRNATILTSPEGVSNSSNQNTGGKKTLLGS